MRIQEEFIVIYLLPCRRKGLIINISSIVGTHLLPLLTLYSSTKVFSHPDVMLTSHRYSDIYTQIFVTMSRSGAQLHNNTSVFLGFRFSCHISQGVCTLSTSQRELLSR